MDKCPSCERNFENLEDYPLVYISEFSRAKTPEYVIFPLDIKHFYHPKREFAHLQDDEKRGVTTFGRNYIDSSIIKEMNRAKIDHGKNHVVIDGYVYRRTKVSNEGYDKAPDLTPKVLIALEKIDSYLSGLESSVGKEVSSLQILPRFEKDDYFKESYKIPKSDFYLLLHDKKAQKEDLGQTDFSLWLLGLNLGSAGGPALTKLCDIARLKYEGRIVHA
ncbi:MAG TPA: hypothetical protein VJH92_05280 [Candidatus Nanoarchaeia archaeon]|nr:hypothetical protein [Candidatus Nanoarchaeia archaeon]